MLIVYINLLISLKFIKDKFQLKVRTKGKIMKQNCYTDKITSFLITVYENIIYKPIIEENI